MGVGLKPKELFPKVHFPEKKWTQRDRGGIGSQNLYDVLQNSSLWLSTLSINITLSALRVPSMDITSACSAIQMKAPFFRLCKLLRGCGRRGRGFRAGYPRRKETQNLRERDVERSAKVDAPGCVNAECKPRQKL